MNLLLLGLTVPIRNTELGRYKELAAAAAKSLVLRTL